MRTAIAVVVSCVGLLVAAAPVSAHHAFAAEFDSTKPVKLRGSVTKMEWINPHSWIHIDVKNADGTVTNWMIECGSPNTLFRRGFTKDSLPSGVRDRGGWLSRQGRRESREWQRRHVHGRKEAVPWFVEPGC